MGRHKDRQTDGVKQSVEEKRHRETIIDKVRLWDEAENLRL